MENKTDLELLELMFGEQISTKELIDFAKQLKSFTGYKPTENDPLYIRATWEIAQRFAGKRSHIYLKPKDIFDELVDIRKARKEHFVTFFLNTRNEEVQRDIVSIGTLNYNLVHPREVFRPAVMANAAGIIVAHNHPSGSIEPSDEDIALTKRLVSAGKLMGIEVLDHVIVTKNEYSSFKQRNLI